MIRTKRIYDPPAPEDGQRVLVDRLWPRGVSKERAALDQWLKAIAPSDALRRAFHAEGDWEGFAAAYRRELAEPERQPALEALAERARAGDLTLLYSVRDSERNHARLIAEVLEAHLD